MLRYYLDKQLLPETETASPEHKPYVELLSLAEIQERKDPLEVPNVTSIRRCKAEVYENEVAATLHIPDFSDEDNSRCSCLFYLEKNSLLLVGNVPQLEAEMQKLGSVNRNIRTPGQLLFDHYQMMHNEHQEEAVRFLTIATSIFMPLTLLTGWYGMNFTRMPELYWKYGYIVVIAVAILILLLELILFKKKKWL